MTTLIKAVKETRSCKLNSQTFSCLGNLRSGFLKWDTIINKSIDPKHITGILSFPLCILNFKESLAFVNLEQIISELQAVE